MTKPERPTVLGWRSPWSGDEADAVPRSYRLWYRLYRSTRVARHLVGLHDWHEVAIADGEPLSGAARWSRCDWCGLTRRVWP
jgi:hypothetical protein